MGRALGASNWETRITNLAKELEGMFTIGVVKNLLRDSITITIVREGELVLTATSKEFSVVYSVLEEFYRQCL